MRKLALAFSAVALVAAGCGAGPEGDEAVLTPGAVVQRFGEEPGNPLLRETGGDPAFRQLSLGLDPTPRQLRRYGVFSVYVVDPERPQALDSLLTDKGTGKPLTADAQGVYWERDTQSRSWVAYKRYGENVVLVWWAEAAGRSPDERFRRLDRVLTSVEQDALS